MQIDKVENRFGHLAEELARSAAERGELLIHWSAIQGEG